MGRQKHVTVPLCIFRGPWLLYSQAQSLLRAVSSIGSPPDFGTTWIKKAGRLPCPAHVWVGRLYTVRCGDHPSPPSAPPPSLGTYTGPLRQPRVQRPFPDILGRTGFEKQQQEAQSPADPPPAAAQPAAGQRHFLPDGQRRGALWPGRGGGPGSVEQKCARSAGRSQLHSAGSRGSCVRAQPRPPLTDPHSRWGPPTGLFLACPIASGPETPSQTSAAQAAQKAAAAGGGVTLLGDVAGSGLVTLG